MLDLAAQDRPSDRDHGEDTSEGMISPASLCTFYRVISGAPEPKPADRAACGSLPVSAYRHCEPVAAASGFGFYLFPPIGFRLIWSGDEVAYTLAGGRRWRSLRGVHYPEFPKIFRKLAPPHLADYAPPFLVQTSIPGVVQVWSGYFVRTEPGWGLWSRGIANRPKLMPYENLEGIVEAATWFGPLFTNIRLLRTNSPIHFHPREPFLQVQPLPRAAYVKPRCAIREASALSSADWEAYAPVAQRAADHARAPGAYGAAVRKDLRGQ